MHSSAGTGDRPLSHRLCRQPACRDRVSGVFGGHLGVSLAAAPCGLDASLPPPGGHSGDRAHNAHWTALASPHAVKPSVCVRWAKALRASDVQTAAFSEQPRARKAGPRAGGPARGWVSSANCTPRPETRSAHRDRFPVGKNRALWASSESPQTARAFHVGGRL